MNKFKEGDIVHRNDAYINYPHTFLGESNSYYFIEDKGHLDYDDNGIRVIDKTNQYQSKKYGALLTSSEYKQWELENKENERQRSIKHHEKKLTMLRKTK